MVVVARPSGRIGIGAAYVARSPADGYIAAAGLRFSHVTNPGLTGRQEHWHPADDFQRGIVEPVNAPVVALVPASPLPVRTLKSSWSNAKQRPGQLNYLMPGVKTSMHLNTEMQAYSGIELQPIAPSMRCRACPIF